MSFIEHTSSLYKNSLCLLLAGIPLLASAQRADTVRSSHNLKEVSVHAPRPVREVSPGQKLQAKDLQRLNSLSVADAARFFAGVQIKDYGGVGGLKTVDVRGMGTNHTGVFYDGIELGNAQNGQVDLGKFSLDNMQEVALYNGQKSSIFQPAKDFASASAIYLTSLKPIFNGDETRHVRATVRTGSFGLFNPSLLWQQKINNRISATFSTEWTNANGRYKIHYDKENGYDTSAIRKNGNINAVRVEGGLNGVIDRGEWSAKVYYYNSSRGLPGFVAKYVFGHQDLQWDRSLFVQSSFRKDISPRYSLLLNAKYAHDYMRYVAPDTTQLMVDNHYWQKEFYFSAANQFTINSWWSAALSADFQWNNMQADLTDFAYPNRYTTLVAASTAIYRKHLSAQASVLGSFVNETVKFSVPAPAKREYTPSFFLSWQPFTSNAWHVRGFYKRIFRMPTFNDLYYTVIGTSNLKPEYSNQYDAGISWAQTFARRHLQEAGVEAHAAYSLITDKIVAMPSQNQARWTMVNLGYVKSKSIEVKAKAMWQFNALQINTRLTYTYEEAEDYTDPKDAFYRNQIPYIPKHAGSFVLGADYKKWGLNFSQLYTGERYDAKANIPENYMQPWYTSDLSLNRSIDYKRHQVRLTAQVNNLFNQYYDVVLNYPMPGRNYKIIIAVNI